MNAGEITCLILVLSMPLIFLASCVEDWLAHRKLEKLNEEVLKAYERRKN